MQRSDCFSKAGEFGKAFRKMVEGLDLFYKGKEEGMSKK